LRPRHLLLVEDNNAHARLVMMALAEHAFPITTDWVADGDEALDYLHRRGRFSERGDLDLVLLDLKLPTVDGFGVLSDIKNHADLKDIPVVVLTTSSYELDMERAEKAGASGFMVKPITYDEWRSMAGDILKTWCSG
jgi:CheY-like chemotaxis protein